MQEMGVPSLGQEDPLEKEMASPSSVLAWRIPWTGEPGGLQCMGVTKESDTTERLNNKSMTSKIVEFLVKSLKYPMEDIL